MVVRIKVGDTLGVKVRVAFRFMIRDGVRE